MEDRRRSLPFASDALSLPLDELDRPLFVFEWADVIRNAVDETDYKDGILPLVFYKTLNDTSPGPLPALCSEMASPLENRSIPH